MKERKQNRNSDSVSPRNEQLIPGSEEFLPVRDFRLGEERANCVARVIVAGEIKGTGFLLQGNWFLTNHHVLPDKESAGHIGTIAQFNYETEADGTFREQLQFHFDPDAGFRTSSDQTGDDWTILKLQSNAKAQSANDLLGAVELSEEANLKKDDRVVIIQHPDGKPKVYAKGKIFKRPAERVQYDASTLGGSSGSPVFNAFWQLVALHHAAIDERDTDDPDLMITLNQGVPVKSIINGLKAEPSIWPLTKSGVERPDIIEDPGMMDENDPWYIERREDRKALRFFEGRSIVVKLRGGANMGKSSMANRIAHALRVDGWTPVFIRLKSDFTKAQFELGGAEFLGLVAEKIRQEAGGSGATMKPLESGVDTGGFRDFLDKLHEEKSKQLRLFLILDEMEQFVGTEACSDAMSGLRVACNRQKSRNIAPNHWLKMLIVYSVEPKQKGAEGSVFDEGRTIELEDFDLKALRDLTDLYQVSRENAEMLQQFFGGHPLLCRLALNAALYEECSLREIYDEASKNGGELRTHLENVLRKFRALPDPSAAADAFRGIIEGQALDTEEQFEELHKVGAVRGSYRGDAVVRCGLYEEWLPNRLPR